MRVASEVRYVVTLVAVLGLGTTALGHHAPAEASAPEPVGQRCVVLLHGKGGEGDSTEIDEQGVATIRPTGNAEAWDGWEWRYFPDESFDEALTIVNEAAAACDAVLLGGFSNGAAFAAKLYCRGETLDGRLLAVVVDDPVPDGGVTHAPPTPRSPSRSTGPVPWTTRPSQAGRAPSRIGPARAARRSALTPTPRRWGPPSSPAPTASTSGLSTPRS